MINLLSAEAKKIFTVRSTYIILGIAALLFVFLSFYLEGFVNSRAGLSPGKYQELIITAAQTISVFGALIVILSMANEYRFNTITYTLTAVNSRTKVLVAKLMVSSLFLVCLAIASIAVVFVSYYLGLEFSGNKDNLPTQQLDWLSTMAKALFYTLGYGLAGLLLATLTRSIAATLVIILIGINLLEGLLTLVLKENSVYMPLTALVNVVNQANPAVGTTTDEAGSSVILSAMQSAFVFTVYLVVGWLVAWQVFLKRDAN